MSEVPAAATEHAYVRVGVLMTLVALALAALIGVIAVLDADGAGSSVAIGVATSVTVFAAGGTIACALSCLVRGRSEILALGGLAVSGLAVDLLVLAIWREIEDETYGKLAALCFIWTLFALPMLGLALAVVARDSLTRALYTGAMGAAAVAGLIASWLVLTTGDGVTPLSPLGLESSSDESLLRPLAAALVLLSTLWFGALAASRSTGRSR